jgi:Bacterial dnaA protein helix-turn-helix
MIALARRAGKRTSGIFRQHGEREFEIARSGMPFTDVATFGCSFGARAVSSSALCNSIGCVHMLQASQAFFETAEPEDVPSELRDGPAYAAGLEARRIIELAVFWVLGAGSLNQSNGSALEPGLILARHVSMYLAHVSCRMSLSDVGRLYARDRTTVAYACAVIEDRRDDPKFNSALELLEWAVPMMAARPAAYRLPF